MLYVNGIALGVLETEAFHGVGFPRGIRQNLDNQQREFIRPFFSTVQLIMAGERERRLALRRDRDAGETLAALEGKPMTLRKTISCFGELRQLCAKERMLEILHDFIVFDAGNQENLPP